MLGIKYFPQMSGADVSRNLIKARMKGNPKAGLRVVEYIDFQCPSCAKGSKILGRYLKEYPEKISIELKYFPLAMHSHAFKSAYYAECAARQGKFWPFHDLLIERQKQWRVLKDAEPTFQNMAKEIELDSIELEACLQDKQVTEKIMKDRNEGQLLGVKSTPTYFINKKMVVGSKFLEKKLKAYFISIGN